MENLILSWMSANKEWLFSGLGCTLLLLIVEIFRRHKSNSNSMTQKSGNNSTNIQVGGNYTVGEAKSKKR
jgi:hypothetical protein